VNDGLTFLRSQTERAGRANGSLERPGVVSRCWWPVFLLFVISCPILSQTTRVTGDGGPEAANSLWTVEQATMASLPPDSRASSSSPQIQEQPYPWRIAAYPVLGWAPIFGTSITLPPTPSHPISSSGSTDGSFNGAYFGGARFEKGKWSGDVLFMWAALSAERKTPFANASLDFVFGNAMVGREVLPNLYVEGGFRRLALNIDATVESSRASASPGYWDPLIGLTYRRQLGKKWRILIHGDGGGFGSGSDVDVTATGRAEWQFARHYGITMGYGGMHFSDSTTKNGGTLTIRPTLHGPIVGFGLFF
jgi:hypothetical protein